ncbi:MAG: hypothetical protein E7081_00335 [Bacteroidales bacterium]|nr:hypothetical protein [Bacteroidales bacterium]
MKKIAIILALICVSFSASAASKYKLYVNPGHGGYTSNDRQTSMPAVNGVKLPVYDVTVNGGSPLYSTYNSSNCFWESSGNTYRAQGIKYFWTKYVNNDIKLSREANTQGGDLTLSTIAAQSNSYGGYFMSLHTNAGNSSANYVVVMCRAKSKSDYSAYNSTSLYMSQAAANWHDNGKLTNVTYSTPRGMTDRKFYGGSGLGVLNTNTAPGFLAESWFHDYRPEAFRMCSKEYNFFLAWQLVRAYIDSPGLGNGDGVVLQSIVVGDIRDLAKSCGYTSYATRGRDKYLAINGAKVILTNTATGGSKTYTTDQFNNGFYTFYDLYKGATYSITVEANGYASQTKYVTIDDNAKQYNLNFDMVKGEASSISVSPSTVEFGELTVGNTSSKSVTVKGTSLSSAISVTSSNTTDFAVSTTSIPASGGTLNITYKPTSAGQHSTTITLSSGTKTQTIVVDGTAVNPPLVLTEVWNYSETSGKNADWTTDKAAMRNMCFGDGKLYVSCPSIGKILIIDAQKGSFVGELDMTGVEGGALAFCDIKFFYGKIITSNIATSEAGQSLKVYVWDNDNAKPYLFLETSDLGGATRLGDSFYLKGDLTNGALSFASSHASDPTKIVNYTITDGVCYPTANVFNITEDGVTGIAFGLTPHVIAGNTGRYWVTGQNFYPTLFDVDGLITQSLNAVALNEDNAGSAFEPFTFRGTSYAFATAYTPNSTASERVRDGRAILVDATDGWSNAKNIGEYPAAGLGNTRNTSYSTSVAVAVNGEEGVEMWILVHNQGIAYYKFGNVPTYEVTGVNSIISDNSRIVVNGTTLVVEGANVAKIQVNAVNGMTMRQSTNSNSIDVAGLSGVYMVTVTGANGITKTSKVVID